VRLRMHSEGEASQALIIENQPSISASDHLNA